MVFSSEMYGYGYGYGYGMVWYCMGKTSACAKPEGGGHLVVQVRQRNADLVDRLYELHFVKHFIKITIPLKAGGC